MKELGKCNICNLICDNRSIKQVKAFCIVYSAFEAICAAFTIVKQLLRVDHWIIKIPEKKSYDLTKNYIDKRIER
jgi:hypothetical protein